MCRLKTGCADPRPKKTNSTVLLFQDIPVFYALCHSRTIVKVGMSESYVCLNTTGMLPPLKRPCVQKQLLSLSLSFEEATKTLCTALLLLGLSLNIVNVPYMNTWRFRFKIIANLFYAMNMEVQYAWLINNSVVVETETKYANYHNILHTVQTTVNNEHNVKSAEDLRFTFRRLANCSITGRSKLSSVSRRQRERHRPMV